jgi:Bacterial regulatory helix-turn-helix protein, lysR family
MRPKCFNDPSRNSDPPWGLSIALARFRPCFVVLENFRIKVFQKVAEHLSVRKAGEALYLTRPAVYASDQGAGRRSGTKLFERKSSGAKVTEAAEFFFGTPSRCASWLLKPRGGSRWSETVGELILGASTTIAQLYCPFSPLFALSGDPVTSVQRKYGARGASGCCRITGTR